MATALGWPSCGRFWTASGGFSFQISGRRRIGKTTLIQQALGEEDIARTIYIQIPDSDPVGVIAACNGYMETFGMTERVSNLAELARLLGKLAEAGKIAALDEFQYFHRKQLGDFCSLLQAEADRLAAWSSEVKGGLIVPTFSHGCSSPAPHRSGARLTTGS